jgi:hypothetical protein
MRTGNGQLLAALSVQAHGNAKLTIGLPKGGTGMEFAVDTFLSG